MRIKIIRPSLLLFYGRPQNCYLGERQKKFSCFFTKSLSTWNFYSIVVQKLKKFLYYQGIRKSKGVTWPFWHSTAAPSPLWMPACALRFTGNLNNRHQNYRISEYLGWSHQHNLYQIWGWFSLFLHNGNFYMNIKDL